MSGFRLKENNEMQRQPLYKMHEHGTQCYNSFSCILSVLIVIFVLGSIVYDLCVTKPNISKNITEIRTEMNAINQKIDRFDSRLGISLNPKDTILLDSIK